MVQVVIEKELLKLETCNSKENKTIDHTIRKHEDNRLLK